jgi:hypothetical protein
MPVYTKASRTRFTAETEDNQPANGAQDDDEDFTVLWSGPPPSSPPPRGFPTRTSNFPPARASSSPPPRVSSSPPPRMSAPPPARISAPPPMRVSVQPRARIERPMPAPQRVSERPPAPCVHVDDPEMPTAMRESTPMRETPSPMMRDLPPAMVETISLRSRRGALAMRAIIFIAVGCSMGIAAEVLLQRRAADIAPEPAAAAARTSFTLPAMATPMSIAPADSAKVQCMPAASGASPAPPPAASAEESAAARAARHRRREAAAAAAAAAASGSGSGATAPGSSPREQGSAAPDDIAAANEALSKAKEETTLP